MIKHPITSKLINMMLILAMFMLGKWIPLPFTYAKTAVANSSENLLFIVSGGSLQQLSIFSLGIQPWMTATIVAGVLSQSKRLKLPISKIETITKVITLVLALVQGFIALVGMKLTDNSIDAKLIVYLVLIAGSMAVMWLAIMNARYGLGNSMMIIMANILQSTIGTIVVAIKSMLKTQQALIIFSIIAAVALIVFAYINVLLDKAEYRIPLVRILIDNEYTERTYIPIKLTPAGGMPVMFALGLMGLPAFIFQFLGYFYPNNQFIKWAIVNFQFTMLPGAIMYMVMLFLLSMMFAYINVDPESLAEGLRSAGDYIPNVEPGIATEKYIRKILFHFALIGAIYIVIISGVPLLWGVGNPQRMALTMVPGYMFMIIGFAMSIMDQVRAIRVKHKYTPIFEGDE